MPSNYTIRQYWRFNTQCPVYYLGPGFLGTGSARDISLKGVLVDGDHGVHVGTILTMAVFLPPASKAITLEKAIVRWAQDGNFGVRMLVMNPEEASRLFQFIGTLLEKHGPDKLNMTRFMT